MTTNSLGYSAVMKPGIGIAVVIDGKTYNVSKDSLNYGDLFKALSSGADLDTIRKLSSPLSLLRTLAADEGLSIAVDDETGEMQVSYEGQRLRGVIASRILELFRAEKGFQTYRKFIGKAIKNRDPDAIDQLFCFMEANRLSIHPDGDVLAFKSVRGDYYDHHSGKVLYKLGTYVSMPREKCNSNPHESCSTGLHVGGDSYVSTFGNSSDRRMLLIKIDPADFVSVPYDYNNSKARVCRLFVYAETTETAMKDVFVNLITTDPNGEAHLKAVEEPKSPAPKGNIKTFDMSTSAPQRDAKGHFVKRSTTLVPPVQPKIPVPAPDPEDETDEETKERVFIHAPTGLSLTASELLAGIQKGQRKFSDETGIPRSTLRGWVASLK